MAVFFLMASQWGYTGYVIHASDNFENMKTVELNATTPNASVFIRFGKYRPEICKDGIQVVSENVTVDFVTYNETYENGTCTSATVLFRNIITEEPANLTGNITTNQTGLNETQNISGNVTTNTTLTINDTIGNQTGANFTNASLSINQTFPPHSNETNTTLGNLTEEINYTENITPPQPLIEENSTDQATPEEPGMTDIIESNGTTAIEAPLNSTNTTGTPGQAGEPIQDNQTYVSDPANESVPEELEDTGNASEMPDASLISPPVNGTQETESQNSITGQLLSIMGQDKLDTRTYYIYYGKIPKIILNETETEFISETQGEAEIGKPVEWTKIIRVKNPNAVPQDAEIEFDAPLTAGNITALTMNSSNPLTVNKITTTGISNYYIFKERLDPHETRYYKIKYETPPPAIKEGLENVTQAKWTKEINVTSQGDIHYVNILTYIQIDETQESKINFYHIINNTKKEIINNPLYDVRFIDTNGNILIDKVEWLTPDTSERQFQIEISFAIEEDPAFTCEQQGTQIVCESPTSIEEIEIIQPKDVKILTLHSIKEVENLSSHIKTCGVDEALELKMIRFNRTRNITFEIPLISYGSMQIKAGNKTKVINYSSYLNPETTVSEKETGKRLDLTKTRKGWTQDYKIFSDHALYRNTEIVFSAEVDEPQEIVVSLVFPEGSTIQLGKFYKWDNNSWIESDYTVYADTTIYFKQEYEWYERNRPYEEFNISIIGDKGFNAFMDPDIAACSELSTTGATYTLTSDILDSSTSYCMNISANNVTLDCQGNTIDGDGAAVYGIYINKSSATMTNITIKNCIITGWDTANVYLENASGNTLTNMTSSSGDNGIYLYYSDSNNISGIKIENNTDYGIYLSNAGQSGPNLIYNNLFNNTNNTGFGGSVYTNYWNTTNQTGTRIYTTGTQIGGNYWINSTGNGYSDTCTDSNKDGFCDQNYTLNSQNIDYLPYFNTDTLPPTITGINATPSPCGFGENVTINVTVTDAGAGVDTVLIEITQPNGDVLANDTMTNITCSIYQYNYTDWLNGTYNYTIHANDTLGNSKFSTVNQFNMYINLTIQVRTTKDVYGQDEYVNLTDPPEPLSDLGAILLNQLARLRNV